MAQAIDIDVDDANRLPTHWLHAAYAGADAPALIAARKAEVAGLFLGDATERGVRDACARGDQAYVARACGTLKSLGDLRVPIAAQERTGRARASTARTWRTRPWRRRSACTTWPGGC